MGADRAPNFTVKNLQSDTISVRWDRGDNFCETDRMKDFSCRNHGRQ